MPRSSTSRSRLQASCAFVGSIFLCWRFRAPWTFAIVAIATTFGLIAWLCPRHYLRIQRGFDFLTDRLLAGLTWLILALVYFGVFAPIRLWRALRRHDPLDLRMAPGANTYLHAVREMTPGRFDQQF
jgi:hypothetical protein